MNREFVIDGELISVSDSNLIVKQSFEIEGTQINSRNLLDTLNFDDIKKISVYIPNENNTTPVLIFLGGGILGAAIGAATVESDEWDETIYGTTTGAMKVFVGASLGLIVGGIAGLIYKSETSVNEIVFDINENFDSESLKPYTRH